MYSLDKLSTGPSRLLGSVSFIRNINGPCREWAYGKWHVEIFNLWESAAEKQWSQSVPLIENSMALPCSATLVWSGWGFIRKRWCHKSAPIRIYVWIWIWWQLVASVEQLSINTIQTADDTDQFLCLKIIICHLVFYELILILLFLVSYYTTLSINVVILPAAKKIK